MGPPAGKTPVPGKRNPFIRSAESRSASPGRITKSTVTSKPKRSWSPSVFLDYKPPPVPEPTKLHTDYVPRSPIRTRASTAQNAQQKTGSTGNSSGGNSTSSHSALLTSNTYGVLSDDDDDQGKDDDDKNKSSDEDNATATVDGASTKNKKQVPIVIPDYPGSAVHNLLTRAGCEFELLILKNSVRVVTLNRPMYEKVVTVLKDGKVPYYSYQPRDKLPVKIVLTGYIPVTPAQLAEVLAEYDVSPQEIRVLSRSETVTGEHVLYLLVFDRGSVKLQDLRRIKTLDGFVVSWRYFAKRPSDAAQCHRCQRFGHGSRFCTLAPKCVKCGEAHLTEQCSLPRKSSLGESSNGEKTKSLVKCANCGQNHTANFRGCSVRKTYLDVLEKQRKKPANRQPQKSTTSMAQSSTHPPGLGRTYASVTASAGGSPSQDAASDGADLFTLTEFLALAREMFSRFRACQNKEQQFMALGELMIKYVGTK